jgi:hypothetical protein
MKDISVLMAKDPLSGFKSLEIPKTIFWVKQ